MDYKKRYKEALTRAKEFQKSKDGLCVLTAESIFPELRESKDEKIRVRDFMMKQFFRPISPDLADTLADEIIKVEKTALNEKQKESEDERIRKEISTLYADIDSCISELLAARTNKDAEAEGKALFRMEGLMVATLQDLSCIEDWLEKQKDASKAIEAVDRIDRYIDEHLANAHDMKDSNPDKKYYRGWDDALGKMAGILQDVYSDEKQKEQKPRWEINNTDTTKWTKEMIDEKFEELVEKYHKQKPAEGDYETEIQKAFREGKSAGRKEVFDHPEEYGLQKPTEWSKNDTAFLNEITDFFENKTVRLQHDIDMYAHWLKSLPERFSLQPKQEWREEDERMLSRCMKSIETSKQFADSDNFKKAKDKEISWFKDLPNRFNLQPKQEWSEEDEKIRDRIIDILNRTFSVYSALGTSTTRPSCPTYKDEINWLKSLRPQPKAELTLLDKNIIEAAVAFVKQNDHFNCWGGIDKHTVIKALRSLKPHWKPSEEQMEAFKGYIEDFQARAEAAVGGWNNFDVMIQLFEQLNKLMQKG